MGKSKKKNFKRDKLQREMYTGLVLTNNKDLLKFRTKRNFVEWIELDVNLWITFRNTIFKLKISTIK